jgi:hypothetical protein
MIEVGIDFESNPAAVARALISLLHAAYALSRDALTECLWRVLC